ncbi:hypothetical protein FSP39_005428 [Pinctada imbricata]|uniref:ditrans,polycis-polyprenyl diphosphate synthase [(2E,6E)-farnesyldiphosphate specific] n=1 Tax=Pinctada imbricata TaxID=66713 RepID=A0AA89BZY6_PINIB|nr:hypothetical protein FSP39_005428 [Pinctada imbricata]
MFETTILRCVHFLISIGAFMKQYLAFFPFFGSLQWKKSSETVGLQSDARQLKKLPLHFAILILEDETSYCDIANIILWSIGLGISYISVYDVNGHLKRYSSKLKEEICQRREEVLHNESKKYHIHINTDGDQKASMNGYSSCNRVDIQILSQEDGHEDLVETTRKLCHRVTNMELRIDDITAQNIDHILQEKHRFPDPDLAVRFGPVDSLLGFLPWQCRLTEILSSPSHIGFQYKSFISLLHIYGKTQQRFGT